MFVSATTPTMTLTTSLLLVWLPLVTPAAVEFTTNGTSGPPCGKYRCLGNGQSACENGECICQGETNKGLGNLVCVKQDEEFAAIFNDPLVRGFDGSHTKIPLVCKFLAAHVATSTCTCATPGNINPTDGICDFRLFGWGRRKRGKTFIRGMQVMVTVFAGNVTYHHSTRIETECFNGQCIYSEDGNTNPFGGPPYDDPVATVIPGHGSIHTEYDSVDNFARIVAEPCGIEVGIRGVEQIGDPLLLPPGMYIKVKRACHPRFLSNESTIFSPPTGHGLSLAEQAQIISDTINIPVTAELVAVQKSCNGQQDFPDAPNELEILAVTIQECDVTAVYAALRYCLFMVDFPRFFKCYDTTNIGTLAVTLLTKCIFSFCDLNRFMCLEVKSLITESGCHTRLLPGQPSIFNFDCDSFVL